jgi:hypothetical protein
MHLLISHAARLFHQLFSESFHRHQKHQKLPTIRVLLAGPLITRDFRKSSKSILICCKKLNPHTDDLSPNMSTRTHLGSKSCRACIRRLRHECPGISSFTNIKCKDKLLFGIKILLGLHISLRFFKPVLQLLDSGSAWPCSLDIETSTLLGQAFIALFTPVSVQIRLPLQASSPTFSDCDFIHIKILLKFRRSTFSFVQIKRIHEYKRQLLNILGVVYRYKKIKEMSPEERKKVVPRVVMFGGKAFATYTQAKRIVKLVTDVGSVVNNDKDVGDLLKVRELLNEHNFRNLCCGRDFRKFG